MHCPPSGSTTILYVDDEAMARKYFALSAGPEYEVRTAATVQAALEQLTGPDPLPDLIVTDYRMPGMSGIDLLRQVSTQYPQVVRLLVTAYADKDMLVSTINDGEVFRILEKPLEQDVLRAALRQAARRARDHAARRCSMEAVEETLAFLAHELNTPLAAVANFARGIGRRAGTLEPDELQAIAADMQTNARYCLSVLSSFMDSVRLAGRLPHEPRVHKRASELVEALLDSYPLTAPQRAMIKVEVRQDFDVAHLPNCVALVLSSLLGNALRALAGSAQPVLRFVVQPGAIAVHDNGPGIAPEIHARLLREPVTGHATAGGRGWGLLLCHRIMQSFGGAVAVGSEPGQSTTITLHFPAPERTKQ